MKLACLQLHGDSISSKESHRTNIGKQNHSSALTLAAEVDGIF